MAPSGIPSIASSFRPEQKKKIGHPDPWISQPRVGLFNPLLRKFKLRLCNQERNDRRPCRTSYKRIVGVGCRFERQLKILNRFVYRAGVLREQCQGQVGMCNIQFVWKGLRILDEFPKQSGRIQLVTFGNHIESSVAASLEKNLRGSLRALQSMSFSMS